jgi:hypothetical protein
MMIPQRHIFRGWLSAEVANQLAEVRRQSRPSFSAQIASPGRVSVVCVLGLHLGLLLLSFLLWVWNPTLNWVICGDSLAAAYNTMWGIHASVSSIALPLLLFVIERARADREAVARSHEVLIRDTFIFPIIAFSLVGVLRIGTDIALFPVQSVFLLDLGLVVVATILLAIMAYYTTLRLLFNPVRMKSRARSLLRERLDASTSASAALRIMNNGLARSLQRLGVGISIFSHDPREDVRYVVLRSHSIGEFADLHLGMLQELVEDLPWKDAVRASPLTPTSSPRPKEPPPQGEPIWLMKTIGDRISDTNRVVLRLERSYFATIDVRKFETRLQECLRVVASDE